MAQHDNFDDDEGFMAGLAKRRENVPMPDSMVRTFSVIAGLVVLLIVALVSWAVLSGGDSNDAVPIIRAEQGDDKIIPDDIGGMAIPNKDSTVFDAMDDKDGKTVENLLDEGEQPLKKEDVFKEPDVAEETPAPDAIPETIPDDSTLVAVAKTDDKNDDEKSAPKPNVIDQLKKETESKPIEKPKVKSVEKQPVKKAADKNPSAVTKGSTYIQLAAVRSEAEAKTKWASLQSQHPLLKGLSLRVNRADLGEKGIFYRVQAGGLSLESATSLCAKIKSAGGGCLVIK